MKSKFVEIVFILDRSGSMSGLESDTIGGFNNMLEKQKELEGKAIVSTILFDNEFKVLHNRVDIKGLKNLTSEDYFVRGSTALLDAVGRSITKIKNLHKDLKTEERPNEVIFIITTDGMENSSREYSYKKIKEMIEHQKEHFKWKFIFLGANIDSAAIGDRFGINKDFTVNYHADHHGVNLNYRVLEKTISDIRKGEKLDASWKEEIDADFNNRK